MRENKKWTIGRIILLILGILLAGVVAAVAITFPYYDSFQKPARSYEALAREMEKLEDVYLPDKPPENATDVSYTYQLENRFLWSKPFGYLVSWQEMISEIPVCITVGISHPDRKIIKEGDQIINGIPVDSFTDRIVNQKLGVLTEYVFFIGAKEYVVYGFADCTALGEQGAVQMEGELPEFLMEFVKQVTGKSEKGES